MPELESTGGPRPANRPKLHIPDPDQVEHFSDRLGGLHRYLNAGFPTAFVLSPRGGHTKLIGWIVQSPEYNRAEAEVRQERTEQGPWEWHPKSGLHRKRT